MSDWTGTGSETATPATTTSLKYLSAIRATIRQFLKDEFVSGSDYDFEDDELDLHIGHVLVDISDAVPYEVKETLATTASSRELDISDIEDLLDVEKIEYPAGSEPPNYHNCSIFGNTLRMGISSLPSADEDVYLYCHKIHQLTEESSTITDPRLVKVLIDGVIAYAALAWINEYRTQLVAAIANISDVNTAVDNMTARMTAAIADLVTGREKIGLKISEATTATGNMTARLEASVADLTSGRAKIGYKLTDAETATGNMATRITQAIADLTSGRALIGQKKTEAIAALDEIATQCTQAIDDLTTGRAQISDTRTTADTAIDSMSAHITQAIADLTSGRALINKVNVGGNPETDFANYAGRELDISLDHLNQAKGLLSEGVTSDRYQGYAAKDLQIANTHIAQARGYMALDVITSEYGSFSAREIANANAYLAQARGYMALDAVTGEYSKYAAREMSIASVYASQARMYLALDIEAGQYANYASHQVQLANSYLSQSGGYIKELTARLNIGRATTGYQAWANNMLALYQQELRRITKPKTYVRYAES